MTFQENGEIIPAVSIRVENASTFDFERVTVQFPGTGNISEFGPIPSGGSTKFTRVTVAYRYGNIRVSAAAQDWVFQPIDYVGERPLGPGRYTYVLGINDHTLTVELA